LAALNSVGEVERVITSAVGQSIQSYVRKGCTNGVAATSGFSILKQNRALTDFGDLVLAKTKGEITLTAPSGTQQAYLDAVAARKNCPDTAPANGTSKVFSTCFKFIPKSAARASASKNSILKANFVFIQVSSEIMNLRDGAQLSCSQAVDAAGLMKCTITGGCRTYSESIFPGSGVKHYYKVFWEMGSGPNRTYSSKEGKIYVPN
jgi:hypothetical protein